MEVLRHDRALTQEQFIQPHLKHIPDYLLPKGLTVREHAGLCVRVCVCVCA